MGERGASAVALVNALLPGLGILSYSAILSQTLQSLFESIGWSISRVSCLLIITATALLPLCLLKNLNVLAPFSVLGTAAIVFAELSMIVRFLDGSYIPGGVYFADISTSLQPQFGTRNAAWSLQVLPFVCMVFESWVMHYNSPRFYTELRQASIPRYGQAITYSFGLSAIIYATTAAAGFLTFGGNADSYILNNYSPMDPLATVSRLAVGVSTLLTYPLVFIGFRDGIVGLLDVPMERQTSHNMDVLTLFLLMILTVMAIFVTDLGMINAIGGGTLATALVFVFPALMYQQAVKLQFTSGAEREVWIAMTLMVVGVILGLVGVWQSITTSVLHKVAGDDTAPALVVPISML
jgi:amino acid permease